MKRKSIKLLSLLMAVLMLITACSSGNDKKEEKKPSEEVTDTGDKGKDENKDSKQLVIEVVAKGFQHQFWKSVNMGAEKAASEMGATITFQGPANETAIQEQVQMFANAINKQPDAIAFAALDTTASIDLLNQAKGSNIPVVGFDSGVPNAPEGTVLATASTDNLAAAAKAAEMLFPEIKAKIEAATADSPVRIGVVSQEVNSASIFDRTKGFIDKIVELSKVLPNVGENVSIVGNDKFTAEKEKPVVIVDLAVPAEVTDADGQTQAQTLLNKQDLIAIFGSNEFGAKSIVNADNAVGNKLGKDKIIGVGFDSGAIQIDAIKKGQLFGSITQDPVSIGYKAVELAVKAARGEEVKDVDTGAVWYNSENIDTDDVKPLLYE